MWASEAISSAGHLRAAPGRPRYGQGHPVPGAPARWRALMTHRDMGGSTHAENVPAIGSVMPFVASVMLTLV